MSLTRRVMPARAETAQAAPLPSLASAEEILARKMKCGTCSTPLEPASSSADGSTLTAACPACGLSYRCIDGIWRMLGVGKREAYSSFSSSYAILREREGWVREPAYYLSLPSVPQGDPTAPIWKVRQRSLSVAARWLGTGAAGGESRWALDLGAGCGWLSGYLAAGGYTVVATDLNVAGPDALEGVRMYMERDGAWIGRVQCSMDRLPFVSASFSLCTVSAALHYVDTERALHEIARVLAPGGLLVITDSPVYRDEGAGQAMAAGQRARIATLLGAPAPAMPGGRGYLVESQITALLEAAGFAPHIESTASFAGDVRARVRALVRRGNSRREHAHFPVIVGRRLGA